jgi:uncharacterized membrane protein YkvA (DUF1232 family)
VPALVALRLCSWSYGAVKGQRSSSSQAASVPRLDGIRALLRGRGLNPELRGELVRLVPDLVVMLRGTLADPRVPSKAKVEAGAAVAYLLSPLDRIIDWVPVIGQLDDVAVVAFALRRLVVGAGEPVLREYWRGSDRMFRILMDATAALATPRGMARRLALVRGLIVTSRRSAGTAGGASSPGTRASAPKVVDGEVLRREDRVR